MNDQPEIKHPYFYDGLVMFPPGTLIELIRRERAKEREECAKLCEEAMSPLEYADRAYNFGCKASAKAIREKQE